jgi:multiple sugar transport system substrate-binding protein
VYSKAFREQLERLRPFPQVPEWERIANEIRLVTEKVAHGDLTIAQGGAELDARTDRILEKRRWMLDRKTIQ